MQNAGDRQNLAGVFVPGPTLHKIGNKYQQRRNLLLL